MVSPLEARALDTTSPFSGAFLIQDGQALIDAVNSGNWVDGGIAAFSATLDTAATIIDPVGTLIANGLGWVLDHIEPLTGWMNSFTGDAAQVAAFAHTWRNVSTRMHDGADLYAKRTHDLDNMSGATIDAYLTYAADTIKHLHATGDWANTIATGMEMASHIVQVVHDLVRDATSQAVGTAISIATEMALTFGLATPAAITQIGIKASTLATKIGKAITRLLTSFKNLHQLLNELKTLFSKASSVINHMLRHAQGVPGINPSRSNVPSREIFENYRDTLPCREANYGSPSARAFQRAHAGGTEFKVRTPDGEEVWADGLRYDPHTGGVVVEAKFVDSPNGSSIYEGTAPGFLLDRALKNFDSELRRYASAIGDTSNPLSRLDIVVSTPRAQQFLATRTARIVEEIFCATGEQMRFTIRVGSRQQ